MKELTNDEMKLVLGGVYDGGDSGKRCKTGSCTLTIGNPDIGYNTYSGNCQAVVIDAPLWLFVKSCYCDVGLGNGVPLSSNGGVSRCTV